VGHRADAAKLMPPNMLRACATTCKQGRQCCADICALPAQGLLLCMANSAMVFFMFSYQVTEEALADDLAGCILITTVSLYWSYRKSIKP